MKIVRDLPPSCPNWYPPLDRTSMSCKASCRGPNLRVLRRNSNTVHTYLHLYLHTYIQTDIHICLCYLMKNQMLNIKK